jgi:hypothetical protein
VGDSNQQNGQYKDKSKDGKENMLTIKTKHAMKFSKVKQDMMWIVCYAWDKYFTHMETNKNARAKRGWDPLNYVLLDHLELQAIQNRNMVNLHADGIQYYPQESLHNLNTTEGVTGEAFNLFLKERSQHEVLAGVDKATRDKC